MAESKAYPFGRYLEDFQAGDSYYPWPGKTTERIVDVLSKTTEEVKGGTHYD